jgi:diguanylate cyclase (GGDEF)-like protein
MSSTDLRPTPSARAAEASGETACDPALETLMVAEQHRVLVRVAPYLYGLVIVVAGSLALAERPFASPFYTIILPGVLTVALVLRSAYWIRIRLGGVSPGPRSMRRDLQLSTVVAPILTFSVCVYAASIAPKGDPLQRALILFAIWAIAVACAFCLVRIAYTAILIIFSSTAPLIVLLLLARENFTFWLAALLLAAASALILLVSDTYRAFEDIVRSRFRMEENRRKAEDAEKVANGIANTDYLTGLPNRRWLQTFLAEQVGEGKRDPFAIGLLDLDGFKPINDIHGHAFGDLILKETARRLASAVCGRGYAARMGGDEFAVVCKGLSTQAEALALGQDLCALFGQPFTFDQRTIHLTCTFGFALFPDAARDADKLVRLADAALYRAKGKRRGGVGVFDASDEQAAMERARMEQALHNAVDDRAVNVAFQPIVDLNSGRVHGFEALARWSDLRLGDVPPSVFIPIAEQIGIIDRLSSDLLRKAAQAATRWPERISLSFNLSAEQLSKSGTLAGILEVLAEVGLSPARLEIEVTETAILKDIQSAAATVNALRAAGVRVALDDFGAGYSSLAQVRDLELDTIKIDRSFVERVCEDPKIAKLTRSIVEMARRLDLPCVAEGIERADQLEELRRNGCARGQGWLFAEAMPEAMVAGFIERQDRDALAVGAFGES